MDGKFITLTEAAKLSPGRPSACAVWRWCRKGIKSRSGDRIMLEHVRAGGKLFTTSEALAGFFSNVAEADREHFDAKPPLPPKRPTNRQRTKSIQRAEATLRAGGIL